MQLIKYIEKVKGSYNFFPYLISILLFSFFVLSNLNNRVMYADESVTAMLGRNILSSGYPRVWDGNNLVMASVNGNEFNDSLVYIRDNWLAYYIAAFGQLVSNFLGFDAYGSVLCMRILFALISILGIVCFYFLVKDITKDTSITFVALLLYSTSVPALLHFRSIYYVALIPTFIITIFLFYQKTVKNLKWKFCFLFILSATLLFHSLFLHFFIAMLSIAVVYFIFDMKKENIKYFIVSLSIIVLLTAPWWIYQRSFLNKVETGFFAKNEFFIHTVLGYLWQVQAYYFPFLTLGLISIIFVVINKIKKKKLPISIEKKSKHTFTLSLIEKLIKIRNHFQNKSVLYKNILTISCPIFFNILIVSLFSSFMETRWLFACIPFLFISTAYLIVYIKKQVCIIGICILILIIFSNSLHIAPYLLVKQWAFIPKIMENLIKPPVPFYNANESGWLNKRADLAEYLEKLCFIESYLINLFEELSNDFYDADKGMVMFFNQYGKRNQKVYLVGFQFETVSYYHDMKVVNRLDPEANPLPDFYHSYPNATIYYKLTDYPILKCDWIIERNTGIENAEWYNEDLFEKIYIDFPESEPWNEIWAHTFYTDRTYSGFNIYRNRKTTAELDIQGVFSVNNLK